MYPRLHVTRSLVRTLALVVFVTVACVPPLAAQSPAPARQDHIIVLEAVPLRPGVHADVHLTVFVNEAAPCSGRTIVAVPGFAHTAATFAPLAEAMFASRPEGQVACRVVALDFPGHGASPAPAQLPFGFLMLDDYVSALAGALERLPAEGVRVDALLAHSQGALVVQLAQQRLTDAGSSLRDAFDVRDVVLLAPVPPQQVPWFFADSGIAAGVLAGFITADAAGVPYVALPDAAWGPVFFSNLAGVLSPHAPGAAVVAGEGFNAPEPFLGGLELIGALHLAGFPPTPRRAVAPGIFALEYGTSLRVVTFENDQIVAAAEGAQTYVHLSGDTSVAGLVAVGGTFAVHDFYVAEPAVLLEALAGAARLR